MRILAKDIPNVLERLTQNIESLTKKFENANLEIRRNAQMLEFLDAYSRGITLYSDDASHAFKSYIKSNFIRKDNPVEDIVSYFETVRAFINEKVAVSFFYKNDLSKFCESFIEKYRLDGDAARILRSCFVDGKIDFMDSVIPETTKEAMLAHAESGVLEFSDISQADQSRLITQDEFSDVLTKFLDIQNVSPAVMKFDDSKNSGFVKYIIGTLNIKTNNYDNAIKEATAEIQSKIKKAYDKLTREVVEPILKSANKISRLDEVPGFKRNELDTSRVDGEVDFGVQ